MKTGDIAVSLLQLLGFFIISRPVKIFTSWYCRFYIEGRKHGEHLSKFDKWIIKEYADEEYVGNKNWRRFWSREPFGYLLVFLGCLLEFILAWYNSP